MFILQVNAEISDTERKTKYFHILEEGKEYHVNLNDKFKITVEYICIDKRGEKGNMMVFVFKTVQVQGRISERISHFGEELMLLR